MLKPVHRVTVNAVATHADREECFVLVTQILLSMYWVEQLLVVF